MGAQLRVVSMFRFHNSLNKDRHFIPMRLDEAFIKGVLSPFHHINRYPVDCRQKCVNLLKAQYPLAKPLMVDLSLQLDVVVFGQN